jgi:hypothetical protein
VIVPLTKQETEILFDYWDWCKARGLSVEESKRHVTIAKYVRLHGLEGRVRGALYLHMKGKVSI